MENVVLIVHLILALGIIVAVLLQRSEGGGLGIGGGGGGAASSRPALGGLGKVTWVLGIAFIITSLTLTVFAAERAAGVSILDRLGVDAPLRPSPEAPVVPGGDLLPPSLGTDGGLTPPRAED
ncbi:preprotein translocase subunit SecG [Rhodobaculum claviforme]|uniref:Protein-export membrane protein SecG n=1 Tax=Rhodobaculum claviforme TaxID=1549854 RepID=A0A934TIK6_9RHOB|nr:preprotein translocase subunit SecG [Rhodobaculum claviforme]MBK5926196.1 preprotein translocase subunit SecG [Rhodobaculum claviforme]